MEVTTNLRFWAKTVAENGRPGIGVLDHCVNVGCVAEALTELCPPCIIDLFPPGAITLAALHDIGKISIGFQVKCPAWLSQYNLTETAERERWATDAERDHAKVSQFFLQQTLKPLKSSLWAVAAGVHHGRIFGSRLSPNDISIIPQREPWVSESREALLAYLIGVFGPLPTVRPAEDRSNLWLTAGLISVADWIGSNESFFPADRGLSLEQSRSSARKALRELHWGSGQLRDASFGDLFGGYTPKPLQRELHKHSTRPGLLIVEGPMGCGKTEAALWAAHSLITQGANSGLYFALPTQVTSNRIHQRVSLFLRAALKDAANFRLAHSTSWLEDKQSILLQPTYRDDLDSVADTREGRSWFTSSKHALLARYGVGTIDQALQSVVAVKHFFVRRFALAGKVVILDEVHSYDVYTGTLITQLIKELLALRCSVIVLSATLTQARRRELISAAETDTNADAVELSSAYPLITVSQRGTKSFEIPVSGASDSRLIQLKTRPFTEDELLAECIDRAEAGHVLYLRNTVAEAQATYRAFLSSVREDAIHIGLLHSRFPFFRRQELENEWLQRLGKSRISDGRGSILIATQVVEQSVDIDLDFIVSDLAPTDMLLQRMGRLWRHSRDGRHAKTPEFWIRTPPIPTHADARALKRALGKSGLVYAPYVLLRTARVFEERAAIHLPTEIREILEATYRENSSEPEAWKELRAELEATRDELAALAEAATRVLGNPPREDKDEMLTRRSSAPTRPLVLLRSCELIGQHRWCITGLDGETVNASGYEWNINVARFLYRNLVRAPSFSLPKQALPPWLSLHVQGEAAWALVLDEGTCLFHDAESLSNLAYGSHLGLYTPAAEHPIGHSSPYAYDYEDDYEFDS